VAICRPDILPSVRPPKNLRSRSTALRSRGARAGPCSCLQLRRRWKTGGKRRGGGSESQVFAPGLVLLFGPNSIFLDSLTQVMQFQTSESQLERTFNLARFRQRMCPASSRRVMRFTRVFRQKI
jgi:hypothetical protein